MAIFRRRRHVLEDPEAGPVPDDMPKRGLFTEPIVVASLTAKDPERLDDDRVRVVFGAVVKDAEGRRCPDLAVDATVTGPERTGSGTGTTDLMGAVTFRMAGPPGRYAIRVDGVAAGALQLDRDASALEAATEL